MQIDFSDNKTLEDELKKDNHEALVFLMNTYHHKLCLYVYSLSNDYESAQDIVQNVFIKIWEDRSKIHFVKSIQSYLYKSTYNRFIDHLRKDKKMLPIEEKHLEILDQIVEKDYGYLIKKMKIEIEKLPSKCKETFLLSKKEGLTNIEIANFMNVSIRTVESQMHKAFKILREKLGNKVNVVLFLIFKGERAV